MCERTDAAHSVRDAAEALKRACQCLTAAGCDLRQIYAAPDTLTPELRALVDQLDALPARPNGA